MIRVYFRTAWRNLMKNKIISFINIFGLTVGITTFLLISLYILDELTFDRSHKNADNIYRVIKDKTTSDGNETKIAGAGYQVSEKSKTDFPEVRDAARLVIFGRTNVSNEDNTKVFYETFQIGNPGFLTTFDFQLLRGNRLTALTAPYSVIVTEETAKKLFNTTDVLGRAIKTDRDSTPFKITAVLKNFPTNSHLSFNLLFSESSITNRDFKNFINSDWDSGAFTTYLLLADKADRHSVEAKINRLVAANRSAAAKEKSVLSLQPLTEIHFYSGDIEGDSGRKGNIVYIYVFSVLGLFVLLIACINYMNLTTAGFARRSKEVGVRKVAGASRADLVWQFLSEAFLITAISLGVALLLVELLLPSFNAFTEKQLTLGINTDYRVGFGISLIVVVVGLLSGMYPALFQSRFKPLLLFKGRMSSGKGNLSLRRSLVAFQFALSITMIIATMIVYMQMKYVSSKNMGFNKNQLAVIDINSGKVRRSAEAIKAEFSKLSQVKDVTVSSRVPGEWKDLPKIKVKREGLSTSEGNDMYFIGIDDQFLRTYQISLAGGRNFMAGSLADSSSIIINETAAKQLGIRAPMEQLLEIPLDHPFRAKVIGIVKDFNFQSFHLPLAPMVLMFQKNPVQDIDYFTARIAADNPSETLKQMDAILHNIDQNHLFEYHFLDKQWDSFYQDDHIRETIFLIITFLTIVIACLGLFGLTIYAAERRIKEIGIRKVLGASVNSIVAMLSKDFLGLILVGAAIAFPVAWWTMHNWLQSYAFRIEIKWWVFIIAVAIAMVIALITISLKAIKAAMANPVISLKIE